MKKYKNFSAFTLVELIIVVAILAILATVSFISYNGYSSTSRDGTRVVDITSITSGLNQYVSRGGIYPMPEGTILSGTINGKEVAYKGDIRDNISRIAGISKTPVDSLTKGYYSYGVSFNGKYFQIGVTLEDSNSVSMNNNVLGFANADSPSNNYSTKVSGNYLGIIKFSTGAYTYLSNIPSLIFNFSGNTNPSSNLLTGSLTYYVIDKNNNYPYKLVDSMNINNKDGNTILQTLTNNSGATLTGVDISSIVNSTGTVASIFSGSVLSSFGYGVDVIGNVVGGSSFVSSLSVINNNCTGTTYSGYTITALNNGVSQTFYKTITGGTGSLQATCTNTVLSYGAENVSCSSGYTQSGSSCTPVVYASCLATKVALPTSADGVYRIKPDSNPAFQAYCDMTTDGGGWTLVGYVGDNGDFFISLKTGGGTRNPNVRSGYSSLNAINLAKISNYIAFSASATNNINGNLFSYSDVIKVTIPSPSTVNFDALDTSNRGTCIATTYSSLKGITISGTMYTYSNALSIPRSSGIMYGIEGYIDNCGNFGGSANNVLFPTTGTSAGVLRRWIYTTSGTTPIQGSAAVWLK